MLDIIRKLKTEHDRLYELSKEKTDIIKKDKMEAFQKLLMQERKQIQAVSQLERERVQAVNKLFKEMNVTEQDKTVTVLLEHMEAGRPKQEMEVAVAELIDRIVEIRGREQLNKDLIQQSMQFVQLSLEMLQPNMKQMNYGGKPVSRAPGNTSVFDSRA